MATVAIIGGGNIGTLMAAEIAQKGNDVRMFTSDAARWSKRIDVYGLEDELLFVGDLALVTADLAEAVNGAEWVFVTHPSSRFSVLAEQLVPLIEEGQRLVVVPGADAELFFSGAIEKGAVLLGLQRVHSIARLKERGRSVYQLGKKPSIQVASIPSEAVSSAAGDLSSMLGMPVELLPNYLVETLTPSNPILHTSRLASMFGDWKEDVTYGENILFYETWDDASSELMLACDAELQELCRAIEAASGLDLSGVRPLTEHYESPDARAMTDKIAHIPAFKGLTSPMKEVAPGEWVPDFSSRYFVADFGIGLEAIAEMAKQFEVETPNIERVLAWYVDVSGAELGNVLPCERDGLLAMYR